MTLLLNSPFNPASLGNLLAWYAADQITSPPASGSALSSWNDLSGNGYTASQATGADQPTFVTNVQNGLPVVSFDGTDDFLAATIPTTPQPLTFFLVVDATTLGSRVPLSFSGSSFVEVNTGLGAYLSFGSAINGGTLTSGDWYYIAFQADGASSLIRVNGSQVASGSAGTNGTSTTLNIGSLPGGDFWPNHVGEVLVYSSALTTAQMQQVEAYLAFKWLATGSNPAISSTAGPSFLPRKLGPKAVGPTFFAGRVPKLVPSPLNVVPTPAVARALVQPGASLAAGAAVTAQSAVARALVPRGITAGLPAPAPAVVTGSPEALPGLQETLTGTVNPEGGATTYQFQWGTSASYGNTTPVTSAGSGSSPVTVNATVTGLTPGTLYHYRLTATNSGGTTNGADQTFYPFVTPAPQTKAVRTWTDQSPFTYCLYDLLSGRFLGTLPFTQVTFGSQLLQPGTFSGTIDVASQAVQNLGPFGLIQEGRTAVLIDYLGSFIWGGIIWTAPYDQDDTKRQVQVTATEIWSWIQNQRVQATDYSAPPYSGITGNSSEMPIWDASLTSVPDGGPGVYDPVLIAWQMLSDALYYVPNANLFGGTGIAANGYTNAAAYLASGTNTPQVDYLAENYPYSSLQQLGSALNQLATLGLGVGFDYGIDVAGSAFGPVTCTINLSYPRRGRAFSQNNLVLDCQRALKFSIPSDGTQTGNTVYEQGANGALSVSQNAQPLNGGYPILERIMSRSNIQSANVMQVLQQTGAADLAIYSYPLFTPTVTTDLFTGPLQLGQFIVGDDVWWRIPATNGVGQTFCPRFESGLDVEARIIGYQATAADAGTSTLQVTLAEPPSYSVQGPWLP